LEPSLFALTLNVVCTSCEIGRKNPSSMGKNLQGKFRRGKKEVGRLGEGNKLRVDGEGLKPPDNSGVLIIRCSHKKNQKKKRNKEVHNKIGVLRAKRRKEEHTSTMSKNRTGTKIQ